MDTINKLLDKARKTCSRDSDNSIALALGVSRNSVSVWRKGGKITDANLMALIELAQADPALAVKVRQEEASSAVERKAWGALWDRLSPVTTVIGAMVLAVALAPATTRAKTLENQGFAAPDFAYSVYYVKALLRWLGSFAASLTQRRRRWSATWSSAHA